MALQVTKKAFESAMQRAKNLQSKVKEASKKTEEIVMSAVETGITTGTAAGFGFVDGRWGGAEVMGMSGDLLAGGLLHTAGFFELGGPTVARFLHAAGNGAMANYGHNMGASLGRVAAVKAKELNPKTGLRKGDTGFVPPTDDEVKSLVSGNGSGSRGLTDSEIGQFARSS